MALFDPYPRPSSRDSTRHHSNIFADPSFVPVWEKSHVKFAQNLLECSNEPIEYCDDDEDYRDNCFFFPEDCVYTPAARDSNWHPDNHPESESDQDHSSSSTITTADMIAGLPDIKMLDTAALTDLLSDNLCPPEITSIIIFATNGAIFAHASPLPPRQLRSLSATYGAAYSAYAVNSPNGNLTGVNPASHPSSFVTAPSVPLGDMGSIVFEVDNVVAVVTKIADKVLLAVMGPTHIKPQTRPPLSSGGRIDTSSVVSDTERTITGESYSTARDHATSLASSAPNPVSISSSSGRPDLLGSERIPLSANTESDTNLETQWEIDRKSDLDRLLTLNLSSSPSILLALESKSAALGRFLSNKLQDLEYPDDF
ncbi:hypothetical protein AJ80_09078 [Polytolypa hystricis UAMH7299]|uniref:Uncharacterized protein n=1 Tax=Polytolypa hystricis (strain UAMH7299) TaxID=1447883 RepID=A0A2B7WWY0_POLH7|nr:hypothetical protein AJ80_09078 [Polytolypa hystricis UAMH7299]